IRRASSSLLRWPHSRRRRRPLPPLSSAPVLAIVRLPGLSSICWLQEWRDTVMWRRDDNEKRLTEKWSTK
ncbi:hypothetical protein LINGRAHAP2_LOCUS23133, partial [Linum grandiflorum]